MHILQVLQLTNGSGSEKQAKKLNQGLVQLKKQGKLDNFIVKDLNKRLKHWRDEDRIAFGGWGALYDIEDGQRIVHPILKIFRKVKFYRSSCYSDLKLISNSPYAQVLKEIEFIRCDEMEGIHALWTSFNFVNVEKILIVRTDQSEKEIELFLENQANFPNLKLLKIDDDSLTRQGFEKLKNDLQRLVFVGKKDEYGYYTFEFGAGKKDFEKDIFEIADGESSARQFTKLKHQLDILKETNGVSLDFINRLNEKLKHWKDINRTISINEYNRSFLNITSNKYDLEIPFHINLKVVRGIQFFKNSKPEDLIILVNSPSVNLIKRVYFAAFRKYTSDSFNMFWASSNFLNLEYIQIDYHNPQTAENIQTLIDNQSNFPSLKTIDFAPRCLNTTLIDLLKQGLKGVSFTKLEVRDSYFKDADYLAKHWYRFEF